MDEFYAVHEVAVFFSVKQSPASSFQTIIKTFVDQQLLKQFWVITETIQKENELQAEPC